MKARLLLLLAAFALYCVISCSSNESATPKQGTPAQTNATQASSPAGPGIPFTAADTKGAQHSSAEWLGKKPVVLNFWGTWCPPCRREIPDLVKLYTEYQPKGIEMVGFAVKDNPLKVQSFANEANMGWVMLMANDQVLNDYNVVNGIPTTIFLDRSGKEITRFIGAQSYEDFKPAFDSIIK